MASGRVSAKYFKLGEGGGLGVGGGGRGYRFACHCSMVAFTELCIDLYRLIWKISPTNVRHVFMLIKLVLVLFVQVQLLTILDLAICCIGTDF